MFLKNHLPANLRSTIVETLLIKKCYGLIGALEAIVKALKTRFNSLQVSESEILGAYFLEQCLQEMHLCFGIEDASKFERIMPWLNA